MDQIWAVATQILFLNKQGLERIKYGDWELGLIQLNFHNSVSLITAMSAVNAMGTHAACMSPLAYYMHEWHT